MNTNVSNPYSTQGFGTAQNFSQKLEESIKQAEITNKPFQVILIQLANMNTFKARRPTHVVKGLFREIDRALRKALHPSQYVGLFQDGVGIILHDIDFGKVDIISKKLAMVVQHVIKTGRYNDISSRWTDILQQFLWPQSPAIISPNVGWSNFPRDGRFPPELIKRALHHIKEQLR